MSEKRIIFDSDEDFEDFLKNCIPEGLWESVKNRAKSQGYIRKSIIEEAEEMYLLCGSYADGLNLGDKIHLLKEICDKQNEAIQELKSKVRSLNA